nr:protein MIZU-KUSSEI 1-like [Ipomoea batatas]
MIPSLSPEGYFNWEKEDRRRRRRRSRRDSHFPLELPDRRLPELDLASSPGRPNRTGDGGFQDPVSSLLSALRGEPEGRLVRRWAPESSAPSSGHRPWPRAFRVPGRSRTGPAFLVEHGHATSASVVREMASGMVRWRWSARGEPGKNGQDSDERARPIAKVFEGFFSTFSKPMKREIQCSNENFSWWKRWSSSMEESHVIKEQNISFLPLELNAFIFNDLSTSLYHTSIYLTPVRHCCRADFLPVHPHQRVEPHPPPFSPLEHPPSTGSEVPKASSHPRPLIEPTSLLLGAENVYLSPFFSISSTASGNSSTILSVILKLGTKGVSPPSGGGTSQNNITFFGLSLNCMHATN